MTQVLGNAVLTCRRLPAPSLTHADPVDLRAALHETIRLRRHPPTHRPSPTPIPPSRHPTHILDPVSHPGPRPSKRDPAPEIPPPASRQNTSKHYKIPLTAPLRSRPCAGPARRRQCLHNIDGNGRSTATGDRRQRAIDDPRRRCRRRWADDGPTPSQTTRRRRRGRVPRREPRAGTPRVAGAGTASGRAPHPGEHRIPASTASRRAPHPGEHRIPASTASRRAPGRGRRRSGAGRARRA
jgi:hypothetical protein